MLRSSYFQFCTLAINTDKAFHSLSISLKTPTAGLDLIPVENGTYSIEVGTQILIKNSVFSRKPVSILSKSSLEILTTEATRGRDLFVLLAEKTAPVGTFCFSS